MRRHVSLAAGSASPVTRTTFTPRSSNLRTDDRASALGGSTNVTSPRSIHPSPPESAEAFEAFSSTASSAPAPAASRSRSSGGLSLWFAATAKHRSPASAHAARTRSHASSHASPLSQTAATSAGAPLHTLNLVPLDPGSAAIRSSVQLVVLLAASNGWCLTTA